MARGTLGIVYASRSSRVGARSLHVQLLCNPRVPHEGAAVEERVSAVPTGKVKWYDVEKGFGFLSQDDGEDVYVRASALPDGVEALKAGQRVEFGMAAGAAARRR